jgi:hypothetical protein
MSIGVTKSGVLQDSLALFYCGPSCGVVVSSFLEIVRVANRFLLEVLNKVQDEHENREHSGSRIVQGYVAPYVQGSTKR